MTDRGLSVTFVLQGIGHGQAPTVVDEVVVDPFTIVVLVVLVVLVVVELVDVVLMVGVVVAGVHGTDVVVEVDADVGAGFDVGGKERKVVAVAIGCGTVAVVVAARG